MSYSSSESSIVLWMMSCLAVLILFTLLMGQVMHRQIDSSRSTHGLSKEIQDDQLIKEGFERELFSKRNIFDRQFPSRFSMHETLEQENESVVKRTQQIRQLRFAAQDLKKINESLLFDYEDCRSVHRKRMWQASAGKGLPDFMIPKGEIYRAVIIKRVTERGLDIQHASGLARIPYLNLPATIQARFEWSQEEAFQLLKQNRPGCDFTGHTR